MSFELPLYRQQKDNTCALACLRMVLAAFGTQVSEGDIEAEVTLEENGTRIDPLERLARQFNLVAEIEETTVEDLRRILADGRFAIAFIDRRVFELTPRERAAHRLRDAKIHTVIPTHVTASSLTLHDPLYPRITRKSLKLFQAAHRALGSRSVVCSKAKGRP